MYDFDTGERRTLLSGTDPGFAASGHLVFWRDGALWAVRFDPDLLDVSGTPVVVVPEVGADGMGDAWYSLSGEGTLAYIPAGDNIAMQRLLIWVDRQGNEVPLDLPARGYLWPRVSPDGTRLVVTIPDPENIDVWISAVAGGTLTRLTTDPAIDALGLWTPDGERVVFTSQRQGSLGLFWIAADGNGEVEHLLTSDAAEALRLSGWTPDGSSLVFDYVMPDTDADIGVLSMEGERTWEPLIATEANEEAPAISPNGQWIAYTSDETGERLVYVERFPQRSDKETISRVPSAHPTWSPDGRELFYVTDQGNRLMVVPLEPGPNLQVGEATSLFEGQYFTNPDLRSYDVSPDGQRFLRIKPSGVAEVILVQNWFEELTRLVPLN